MRSRISAVERVRFEVVTTIPCVGREVEEVRVIREGASSGLRLVGVIRCGIREPGAARRSGRKTRISEGGAST